MAKRTSNRLTQVRTLIDQRKTPTRAAKIMDISRSTLQRGFAALKRREPVDVFIAKTLVTMRMPQFAAA